MPKTKVPAGPRGRPTKNRDGPAYTRFRRGLRCIQGWVETQTWVDVKVHAAKHHTTISDIVTCAVEKYLAAEKEAS